MLRFLIKVVNRIERELAWIHHYYQSHGIRSLRDVYLCLKGFSPTNYSSYDTDTYPLDDFITDKTRFFGLPRVHDGYMFLLKDKFIFRSVLEKSGFGPNLPRFHKHLTLNELRKIESTTEPACLVSSLVSSGDGAVGDHGTNGSLVHAGTQYEHPPSLDESHEVDLLDASDLEEGVYILKPSLGSSGDGIIEVRCANGSLSIADADWEYLQSKKEKYDTFMLEEKVRNAEYSAGIFDGSLNTIRLMTAWDYKEGTPFVAGAAHRFGTQQSAPTDNAGRGGIFCPIDLNSGTLGPAIEDGNRTPFYAHPDTDATIEGTTVRKWAELKDFILEAAAALHWCPLIGWDVVIDATDRFVIIEGNPTPGVGLVQADVPLLAHPDMRRFMEHHSLA